MKETIYSKCIDLVSPHLTDGVMLKINYLCSALHFGALAKAVCAAEPNPVLGCYPPAVNIKEEETLTRVHCCALRQLRSGYCHRLRSYLHSIGKADDNLCPESGVAVHTTRHIFQCRFFPTDLLVKDLWYKPCEAAIFVSNLPSFIRHLPPVAPPSPSNSPRTSTIFFFPTTDGFIWLYNQPTNHIGVWGGVSKRVEDGRRPPLKRHRAYKGRAGRAQVKLYGVSGHPLPFAYDSPPGLGGEWLLTRRLR
jgi:hypothetical protein